MLYLSLGWLRCCGRISTQENTRFKECLITAAKAFIKAIMLGKKKWSALVQQVFASSCIRGHALYFVSHTRVRAIVPCAGVPFFHVLRFLCVPQDE